MKKFKNEKGITLVALVVTIIVLIILAGVSINLILGDNGIITIAKKAKENTELAKTDEETQLNELYSQLEAGSLDSGNLPYDSITKLTEFKTAIANAIDEAGGIRPDTTAETAVFADNIKGIVKEVTKDATATANDIAKGKTAWVNGALITGTAVSEIDTMLYTSGTEGKITGGWSTLSSVKETNYGTGGNTPSISVQSKTNFNLYFGDSGSSAWGYGGFKTNNYIDLSNYSVLKIKGTVNSSSDNDWVKGFYLNLYDGQNYTTIYKTISLNGTKEVDISNYNGKYIIIVCACDFSQLNNSLLSSIYQISLE